MVKRNDRQPPIRLNYRDLLEDYIKQHYPTKSVAVVHAGQVECNLEKFYALLKRVGVRVGVNDPYFMENDIILVEMDTEKMVGFVNKFPIRFCYVEGWENGQCVTENT